MSEEKERKLTVKQKRFIEEYCANGFNATKAAIAAGYTEDSARQVGHENLTKPDIRDEINAYLRKLSLNAEETTKLISDIARSNLNEYFTVKEALHRPLIKKHLSQVIREIQEEIELEREYFDLVEMTEEEKERHWSAQENRKKRIIRLELQLKRDPFAFLVEEGKPELIKVAELDMVRLVQDRDAGRIKSVTPNQFGTKVELYAADGALRDLARMHGLYEKDNQQSGDTHVVILPPKPAA